MNKKRFYRNICLICSIIMCFLLFFTGCNSIYKELQEDSITISCNNDNVLDIQNTTNQKIIVKLDVKLGEGVTEKTMILDGMETKQFNLEEVFSEKDLRKNDIEITTKVLKSTVTKTEIILFAIVVMILLTLLIVGSKITKRALQMLELYKEKSR